MKMETRSRAIDKVYKRRDRIEMPDFQREEVWPEARKKLLIDSILKGWHLPKFYFRKGEDGVLECVDGQQRLSAIFSFFGNEFTLGEITETKLKGKKYSELDDDLSDAFDDFEIEIEEIEDASEDELRELFKRLQLGTPLNTAERINAIRGELRDFCIEISKEPFFSERIGIKNTRYAHFETVVRWAHVEARGTPSQMRYPQLESLLEENKSFSRSSDTAKNIKGAINFLGEAFPQECRVIRNRANLLSVCMLASRVYGKKLTSGAAANVFRDFIHTFFAQLSAEVQKGAKSNDRELLRYQQAITANSAGGDSVQDRISILMKRLATHSPAFTPLLSSYPRAKETLDIAIDELADVSRVLVYDVNRLYSATNGEDRFKMTNKSSKALQTIGVSCRDRTTYDELIDALYILVYEGSGNCKRLPDPVPTFAMDIKFLRGDIRHDLDHGKKSEISKKTTRNSDIFKIYSGKATPEECGPDDFIATQFRILEELVTFLSGLKT